MGSIIITYLTVKYKDQITKKFKTEPRDRMDTIFDGYEKLIKQQQADIEHKTVNIGSLQDIVNKQRRQIEESQIMIDTLKIELEEAKGRNIALQRQLETMKKDYKEGS